MAIITTYPDDSATTDSDKFLTSDSSGATKLTTANTLKTYMSTAGAFPGTAIDSVTLSQVSNSSEYVFDFVALGGVWSGDSYASTHNASMTAVTCYINGQRGTISAVTALSFTASKDTYVDILNSSGTFSLVYTEIANNSTASPALAANSIRLGIVVTNAFNISNQYSINQGQIWNTTSNARLPNYTLTAGVPTATDYNGVILYPTKDQTIVSTGGRSASTSTGPPGGTSVAWNGNNWLVFIAKANTNYRLLIAEAALSGVSPQGSLVFEAYLDASANTYTSMVGEVGTMVYPTATGINAHLNFNTGSYSGKTYLNLKIRSSGWSGTLTMNSDTTRNGSYTIEEI